MSFNLSTKINNLYFLVNQLIGGSVTNPMTTTLNANSNNITNVNDIQVSTINGSTYALPISNRTSSTTVSTVGTGFATLLQNTIVTTAPFDIDIWATINYSYTHTSGGVNGVVRVLFDGSPVGNSQTISLDNNNLNGQVSIIASFLNASIGSHTITLQMQKSASGGTLQHLNSTMLVIGNIA
jgi:hypothetical protein